VKTIKVITISRSSSMKKLLIGTVVVATLALSGLSAHASCADPRLSNQSMTPLNIEPAEMPPHFGQKPGDDIVGTWYVVYTTEGSDSGAAFIQWHSDGTEWENINYPVLGGNICLGSWKPLDHKHVQRNHFGWLYDNNGLLAGYFHETETDELAADGNSYIGTNETTLYLPSTPPIVSRGTAKARRIAP
jgi:hypothetical protein